jgi:hypothetical protein
LETVAVDTPAAFATSRIVRPIKAQTNPRQSMQVRGERE